MAGKAKGWVFLRRSPNGRFTGGAAFFIDGKTLKRALQLAHIPLDAKLKAQRLPTMGSKGVAKIILSIKERDKEDLK